MKHVFLIFQLRWMLFKNSLRIKSNWLEVGTAFFVGAFAFILDVGAAFGLGALAYHFYGEPMFVEIFSCVLGGISIMWLFVPILTLTLGDQVDVVRFGIYPLTMRELMGIDVLLGLFDPVGMMAIPLLTGIGIGCAMRSPSRAALMAGMLLIFFLFNLILSRYIQRLIGSFFATRRRKEILGILILLLFFIPQILISINSPRRTQGRRAAPNQRADPDKQIAEGLERLARTSRYLAWTPPGIAARAVNDEPQRSAVALLLLVLIGSVFTGSVATLEYQRVRREFSGRASFWKRRMAAPKPAPAISAGAPPAIAASRQPGPIGESSAELKGQAPTDSWIESLGRILPGASAETLAVFEKDVRYLYRSPRALLMIVAPVLGCLIFVLPGTALGSVGPASEYKLTLLVFYCLFAASSQVFNNAFSFDSHGAKLYFMSPIRGADVLKGKNLAATCAIVLQIALVMILYRSLSGTLPITAALNALLVLAIALPFDLLVGNYLSVLYPKAMDFSKVYGRTYSGVSAFISLAAAVALAGVVALGPAVGWLTNSPVLQYSILTVELVISWTAYWIALRKAGRLLDTRGEAFLRSLLASK
jgi:hypothetical protein